MRPDLTQQPGPDLGSNECSARWQRLVAEGSMVEFTANNMKQWNETVASRYVEHIDYARNEERDVADTRGNFLVQMDLPNRKRQAQMEKRLARYGVEALQAQLDVGKVFTTSAVTIQTIYVLNGQYVTRGEKIVDVVSS